MTTEPTETIQFPEVQPEANAVGLDAVPQVDTEVAPVEAAPAPLTLPRRTRAPSAPKPVVEQEGTRTETDNEPVQGDYEEALAPFAVTDSLLPSGTKITMVQY